MASTNNGYQYSGYPNFNCPDEIVDGAKNAGFDMLLTANNHCYDTQTGGVIRTLEVLEEAGLESLGTQKAKDDPDYKVIEVNGIPGLKPVKSWSPQIFSLYHPQETPEADYREMIRTILVSAFARIGKPL